MPRQMNSATTRKNWKANKSSCDKSNASKSAVRQGPKKEVYIPEVFQRMEDSEYFVEKRVSFYDSDDYDYDYDNDY